MTLKRDAFAEMLEELAPLLAQLPRDGSQGIVESLTLISRLLHDLDVAETELERKVALVEAERIVRIERKKR